MLTFSDSWTAFIVEHKIKTPVAKADSGDFSIFRNNSDTTSLTTTPLDVTWDTTVTENANITLQPDNSSIDLSSAGKYLVMYNVWASDNAGTERRSIETYLSLDGTAIPYGRGAGYIRDTGGDLDSYNSGAAIVDVTAGQDLEVVAVRDDTEASQVDIRPGKNGVSVLKMKDDLDYLRIYKDTDTTGVDTNTTFTDVTWGASDEVDTGSFAFTDGSGNITLKGPVGAHFLVTSNVRLEQTAASSDRLNFESRLTLDGVEIPATRVTTYLRGNPNSDGTYYGALVYMGIIQKTSASDQTLNIEMRKESIGTTAATKIVADKSALSVVALPDGGDYISLTSTSSSQTLTTTRTAFNWDEQLEVDTTAFSHSTTTNNSRINFDLSGDYIFFSTAYATRTSGTTRSVPVIEWNLDGAGSPMTYGGHGSYNRGDQGSNDAFTSGSSGGVILDGITDTQYLEVMRIDEAANTNPVFNPWSIGVQGVEISKLFIADIDISATSSHATETDLPTTGLYSGGGFVIQPNNGTRNVTSVTLTESGTVDAQNGLDNIELWYDLDTTAPYDCTGELYDGDEIQFGSTDTTGFSGPNGVSSFTGSVQVTDTKSMCLYTLYDVTSTPTDGETVKINLNNPSTDVVISGDPSINTSSVVSPTGSTILRNAELTQIHYNWRNDDGSETTATSIEGTEDTPSIGFANGTTRRLRVEVSAEGSTSSPAAQYRLEYGQKISSCAAIGSWIDVGTGGGGDWDIVNTANLTDGNNTTNVALQANGGVTDENTTFLTPNGGQKDTSSQTGNITLSSANFVEIEYALEPTSGAPQGNTYCFRVTDAGTALRNYDVYPEGTISADIDVSASSTQVSSLDQGSTGQYVGGTFVIERLGGNRTLTGITITETGTVDAQNNLDNIEIYYDLDTTTPYDCTGEVYNAGSDSQWGVTDTTGFSWANGSSTFTGSQIINSTQAFCGYVVFDVGSGSTDGETINIEIADPSSDVVVTASSVGPSTAVSPTGSTTIAGTVLTQTHYHWRNDNGTEASASSATGGSEDTALFDVAKQSTKRIRLQVSNEGSVTSQIANYRLEYGTKISTCSAVGSWSDVDVGAAFEMVSTSQLTEAGNTTDIAPSIGGMTNENSNFLSPNGGQKENDSETGNITLTSTQFVELEYAIRATEDSGYDTTYCFRVTDAGNELESYTTYGELTTRDRRDFYVQRGTAFITGLSQTFTAGTDYVAPSASTSAFVRITNTQITGAGTDLDVDQYPMSNNQNADDVTVYISDPENIETSFTITRPATASTTASTSVAWEIVEFIGLPGGGNEMIVRDQGTVTYGATSQYATGTAVTTVADNADVVVFITGQDSTSAGTVYYPALSTAMWHSTSTVPVFQRGVGVNDVSNLSYAVVEYTGSNWAVQRSEHTYTSDTVTETESISAVSSLSRTFLHAQKRIASTETGLEEMGHEVWLSSVGLVSYRIDDGSNNPGSHTSVAWVIENTKTGDGEIAVHRSNGLLGTGAAACSNTEPCAHIISIGATILGQNNSSIFASNRSDGNGTAFPRPIMRAHISSDTQYTFWRSDTGQPQNYRTEVVEWPISDLTIKQNYYQFYVDNDALDPTDPWPVGVSDIGENSSITVLDDPVAESEVVRIRMTLAISEATLPQSVKSFKLQYGKQDTTCSAIGTWNDLGAPGSGEIWRGYNGTPADGTEIATSTPAPGTLNISISDVAGSYEEENSSVVNPYSATHGQDIEYDWAVQHNGALQKTDYCFRMVESDNTLLDAYNNYPTLRTTGYSPVSANWRWYDDSASTTPIDPMSSENVAPIDVANENEIKLRVSVHEIENASGPNVKFGLQYSQRADFSDGGIWVTSTTTCTATSTWCYAEGGGVDGTKIDSALLTDSDSCVGGSGNGCGHHNEGTSTPSTLTHPALSKMEFEFTLKHAGARVNSVYYFRLYDLANDDVVFASSTYPSLVTEGASLVFTMGSLASTTVIEGVTLDIDSTPTTMNFGSVPPETFVEGAHRLSIDSNGTEGYKLLMSMSGDFQTSFGSIISPITSTNAAPLAWATGCELTATSCFGYHTSDDTLEGGSTRFSAIDTYARVSTTTLDEVGFNSQPAVNETVDVVYRILRRELQEAGLYEARMIYISVPIF